MDEPATPRTGGGHVVLCGLNELGYRTLEELARMGAEVVVVVRIRLRMFNQELGRRVERLFRDCQVLDAAALVAPAFVAAAVHRDAQQAIEVGGRRLVVRRGSAVEPEVLLPLASVDGDGTGELFPSDGNDLLCLAVEAVAGGVGAHGAARRRNRPGRLATAGRCLPAPTCACGRWPRSCSSSCW